LELGLGPQRVSDLDLYNFSGFGPSEDRIKPSFLFLNWRDYFAVHVHVKKIFAVMAINSLNSHYHRPEAPLDQEQITAAYPVEHGQLEVHPKPDFVRESSETDVQKFLSRSVEDIRPRHTDTNSQSTCFDVPDQKTITTPQEERISAGESQPARKRSVCHGSNHTQKSEELRNEPSANIPKVTSRGIDSKEPAERPEEKPKNGS